MTLCGARQITLLRHGSARTLARSSPPKPHPSELQLEERGWDQARHAGRWLREYYGDGVTGFVCSEFVRARQTAQALSFPGARWLVDPYLVEGSRGVIDTGTSSAEDADVGERYRGPAGWFDRLPGIERKLDVAVRAELAMSRIGQLWPDQHVVVVAHAALIWRLRMRIEGWSIARYTEETARPGAEIGNCDAIEYRRIGTATWFSEWRQVGLRAMLDDDPPAWSPMELALVDTGSLMPPN